MEKNTLEYPPLDPSVIKVAEDAVKAKIIDALKTNINVEWLYKEGIWHRDHQQGLVPSFKTVEFAITAPPFQIDTDIVKYFIINWTAAIWANNENLYTSSHNYKSITGFLKDVQVRLVRDSGIENKWKTSFVKFDFDLKDVKEAR